MKKTIILFLCLSLFLIGQAQVSKTINVTTPGTLSSYLKSDNKSMITNMTITGNIDARDLKLIRDSILNLAVLDVSAVTIVEYEGVKGTFASGALYPANELPAFSFYNGFIPKASTITSVLLPNSITSIGAEAFAYCIGLTKITIPNSVTIIGTGAFDGCKELSHISIPNSVKTIGSFAFYNCVSIESLTLPAFISEIGIYAFCGCTGISNNLVIPRTLSEIAGYAFALCSGMKGSLVIPNTISDIGERAFASCSGISGELIIPNTVISIGTNAFYNCSSLTTITIPQSVKSIGTGVFAFCYNLDSIHSNAVVPVELFSETNAYEVFEKVDKTTCILYVPIGSASAYKVASQWKDFNNIIEEKILPVQNLRFIDIYPNFVSDKFQINGINEPCRVSLFDLNGRLLLTKIIIPNEYISVNSLPKGAYLVKISTSVGVVTRKILKIKP